VFSNAVVGKVTTPGTGSWPPSSFESIKWLWTWMDGKRKSVVGSQRWMAEIS